MKGDLLMEIIVTPKKEAIKIDLETGKKIKLKVAGYARVSTDLDDQKNSFEFQKLEFETRIKQNPEWEFVGMYSDEGISGTSINHRDGFKNMVEAAKRGEINHILTKSISRFARNTVDFLNTVRELAKVNVSVYFEKENITTNKDNIDLILTLYASLAESESRSISENVKWGVRKRMSKNERKVPVGALVGYSQHPDGTWYINEDSILIKKIFEKFLEGYTFRQIIAEVKAIDTNKERSWSVSKIGRILRCEKYKGFIIHQKTVIIDVLTHKQVKNDGIEPMYTIRGHHEAIIPEETFDYVQIILDSFKGKFGEFETSNKKEFSGMVFCEKCNRVLRRITYQYNKQQYLTCKTSKNNKNEIKSCDAEVIPLSLFKEICIDAYKNLRENKTFAASLTSTLIAELANKDFVKEISEINTKIESVNKSINELVKAQVENNSKDYPVEFSKLKAERNILQNELKKIKYLAKNNYELQRNLTKIDTFLKENSEFDYLHFKEIVYRIIHRTDGSFRFLVKGENFDSLSNEQIDIQAKEKEPLMTKIVTLNDVLIKYDVITLEGLKND